MHTDIRVTWPLLAQLRAAGAQPNQAEAWRKRLAALLGTLDAATVSRLHFELHALRVESRDRSLWCAASLWLGHWLDDQEFSAFRAWLIAHGEATWQQVRAHPDALAGLAPRIDRAGGRHAALAPLNATPGKIYQRLVADDDALDQRLRAEHDAWCAALPDGGDDTAIGWAYWTLPDAEELASRFPRLWADCGDRWPVAQADPFADFLREVRIPGLGVVKIGDTLLSRHDGRSFVVEGLSDMLAGFTVVSDDNDNGEESDDDDEAPEGTIIARVRHADGTVACNQGLSRRYQRWPHEAAEGPLPGDSEMADDDADDPEADATLDAWEARDDAIQARLAAQIEGEMRVIYAAAPDDAEELPLDNLDDVAVRGPVCFVEVDAEDGERFESDVLESPTWMQVAILANRMMCELKYDHHVYLEGIEIVRRPKGKPKVAAFVLGS